MRTFLILFAVLTFITSSAMAAKPAKEKDEGGKSKTYAQGPSDAKVGRLTPLSFPSFKKEKARPIEETDLVLSGGAGYYANHQNSQGLALRFKLNKTWIWSRKLFGFRIDPGVDAQLDYDLTEETETYRRIELSTVAVLGARKHFGTASVDFAAVPLDLVHTKDSVSGYTFSGMRISLARAYTHFSLPYRWDMNGGISLLNLRLPLQETKLFGNDINPSHLTHAHGELGIGRSFDFGRLGVFFRGYPDYYQFEKRSADLKGLVWRINTGFALDRIGGSPIGLEYRFDHRYAGLGSTVLQQNIHRLSATLTYY